MKYSDWSSSESCGQRWVRILFKVWRGEGGCFLGQTPPLFIMNQLCFMLMVPRLIDETYNEWSSQTTFTLALHLLKSWFDRMQIE